MSQENVEIVEVALEAVSRGDLPGFLALVDPDVEFTSLITEADEAVYRGHDGVERWLAAVRSTFADFRTEPVAVRAAGPTHVIAKLVIRGTVNGVEVTQPMWQAVALRGGKVTGWTIHRSEETATAAVPPSR